MLKTWIFFNRFSTHPLFQQKPPKTHKIWKKLLKTLLKINFQQFQQPQQQQNKYNILFDFC